jgi:hypothetical protein
MVQHHMKAVGRPLTPSTTIQAAGTKQTWTSVTCMWNSRMVALVLYIKETCRFCCISATRWHCEQYIMGFTFQKLEWNRTVNNICKNLFLFLAKYVKMIRFGALKFARKGDQNTLNFDNEKYVQYSTLPESEMHTLYMLIYKPIQKLKIKLIE